MHAKLRYNLTADENFPDEEGTETCSTVWMAVDHATPDENFPDEEGTETGDSSQTARG